jgi:DNA-binding HxlR family transcriptional regulator
LNRYRILTTLITIFSIAETVIAVSSLSASSGPSQSAPGGPFGLFWQYSLPFSAFGWIFVGLSVLAGGHSRKSRIRSLFAKKGFSGEVFDLMIGMRGGGSRLALLRGMQEPKHRQELADITGIDWKEVDRQIGVLEKYGLVKMYAQSGTVQIYQITEQGKLLLNLVEDLQSPHQRW